MPARSTWRRAKARAGSNPAPRAGTGNRLRARGLWPTMVAAGSKSPAVASEQKPAASKDVSGKTRAATGLSECSAAWSAHLSRAQEAAGSNPATPIRRMKDEEKKREEGHTCILSSFRLHPSSFNSAAVAEHGIRAGLRRRCSKERVGSTPTGRTGRDECRRNYIPHKDEVVGSNPTCPHRRGGSSAVRARKRFRLPLVVTPVEHVRRMPEELHVILGSRVRVPPGPAATPGR
jgi:hypothetical protein